MMTDGYQKAIDALQLNGLCPRSQEAYVRAVRRLVECTGKSPDDLGEPELQQYFLHRKNQDHWSPDTLRIGYCGSRHFFVPVLRRDWHTRQLIRAENERRLPAVLSREEVAALLRCVPTPHHRTFLATVYRCGLRLQEAQFLEVSDLDSHRRMIPVHRGQGAKDRFVPLPDSTLQNLRRHGARHRHPRRLFPAQGRSGGEAATADAPMAKSSVQGAFRQAQCEAGMLKKKVSVPTLRQA